MSPTASAPILFREPETSTRLQFLVEYAAAFRPGGWVRGGRWQSPVPHLGIAQAMAAAVALRSRLARERAWSRMNQRERVDAVARAIPFTVEEFRLGDRRVRVSHGADWGGAMSQEAAGEACAALSIVCGVPPTEVVRFVQTGEACHG